MLEGTEWETLYGLQLFLPTGLRPRLYEAHMDNIDVKGSHEWKRNGKIVVFFSGSILAFFW